MPKQNKHTIDRHSKKVNKILLANDPDAELIPMQCKRLGNMDLVEAGKAHRFKKGVSGNPAGRPKGAKGVSKKSLSMQEAFDELSLKYMLDGRPFGSIPEMMTHYVEQNFTQDTPTAQKQNMEIFKEAHKYMQATANAKEASKPKTIEDISSDELAERISNLRIVNDK